MVKEEIHILNESEIIEELRDLPGWEYRDNKLVKEFKFMDYYEAINYSVGFTPQLAATVL